MLAELHGGGLVERQVPDAVIALGRLAEVALGQPFANDDVAGHADLATDQVEIDPPQGTHLAGPEPSRRAQAKERGELRIVGDRRK
jgi:hypothetical protein